MQATPRQVRFFWLCLFLLVAGMMLAAAGIAFMDGPVAPRPLPVPYPTIAPTRRPTNDIAPTWVPKYPSNSALPGGIPLTPLPTGAILPLRTNRPMALARYGYECHCSPANAATGQPPVERHMDGGVLSTRGP